MMRWLGVACLMTMVAAPAFAQKACDTDVQVGAVERRQHQLLQQTVEEMSTEVPAPMQTQLSGLKDALAAAVEVQMRCTPAAADAAVIEGQLVKLLAANQPEKPLVPSKGEPDTGQDKGPYSGNLKIAVTAPANAPQLRAVTVSYGIECGEDSMLLLYEPAASGWRRVLRWQSPEYTEISGAFGNFFEYAVLPGTPLKIAVAHGTDWCTSNMSAFKIDLLTPQEDGGTPRVVWRTTEGYRRETDPRMKALPDGFELRVDVSTIELDQVIRKGVFRYKVSGDSVERVQPIAVDGRGFVDAWLQAPWSAAKGWSAPEGLAGFERAHDAFTKMHDAGSVTYSYGPVRACTVKDRYEVEIDADPGGPQFYAIAQGTDGYTMVNFGTTQDERCSGPDLMKKR
jgi:hypothetical protein